MVTESYKKAAAAVRQISVFASIHIFAYGGFCRHVTTNHVTLTFLSFWKCYNHGDNVRPKSHRPNDQSALWSKCLTPDWSVKISLQFTAIAHCFSGR